MISSSVLISFIKAFFCSVRIFKSESFVIAALTRSFAVRSLSASLSMGNVGVLECLKNRSEFFWNAFCDFSRFLSKNLRKVNLLFYHAKFVRHYC